jgi:3-oxoacyl-(acyl-carrier-protein) synthase
LHNRVVVTGLGPVTGIGIGCDGLWSALAAERSNVQSRALLVDLGRVVELPIVSMPPVEAVDALAGYATFFEEQGCAGHRDLAYTLLAIELALADARLPRSEARATAGLVQAFEAPGVERTVSRLFEMMSSPLPPNGPPPVYDMLAPAFYNMQPFFYVQVLGKALDLHGFSTSVHNACSSGAFAIETAAQRIRAGHADVMVVAGGEAFDTAVRLEWFRRLELYATNPQDMRPFDPRSQGFYVGEGAAALVLESESHARRRGATIYAEYAASSFAHQAWKQTVPDVRSARLAAVISESLKSAVAESIDLIVPHGAATQLSDAYEADCLGKAFANADCEADSGVTTAFKPYVGHMLAASVLIDTICALLAMKHSLVPPTPNSNNGLAKLPAPLALKPQARTVAAILKLATGFTGHDAALVFRKAAD